MKVSFLLGLDFIPKGKLFPISFKKGEKDLFALVRGFLAVLFNRRSSII